MLKNERKIKLKKDGHSYCYSKLCSKVKDEEAGIVAFGGYIALDHNELYEYDIETGEQLSKMGGIFEHFGGFPLTMSSDGKLLALCDKEGNVVIVDTADGSIYCAIEIDESYAGNYLFSMRFSPNNQMIVVLLFDVYIIYKVSKGEATMIAMAHHFYYESDHSTDRLIVWNESGIYFALGNQIEFVNPDKGYESIETMRIDKDEDYLSGMGEPVQLQVSADGKVMLLEHEINELRSGRVLKKVSADYKYTYTVINQWKSIRHKYLTATLISDRLMLILTSAGFCWYNLETQQSLTEKEYSDIGCLERTKLHSTQ